MKIFIITTIIILAIAYIITTFFCFSLLMIFAGWGLVDSGWRWSVFLMPFLVAPVMSISLTASFLWSILLSPFKLIKKMISKHKQAAD